MQGIDFIFGIAILIMSVVMHEVSHGQAALMLGDPTAKLSGRLSLNPVKHLDLFGSVLLPILTFLSAGFIIGWAKPVPYNPYNLKNQKWGPALVALAGPGANIVLALIFGIILRTTGAFAPILLSPAIMQISLSIILINLILAVFNLTPIPPLDGSKILFSLFPYRWNKIQFFLEQWGFAILIFFILFLFDKLFPLINLMFRLITGLNP